jgi:hypothetical protein
MTNEALFWILTSRSFVEIYQCYRVKYSSVFRVEHKWKMKTSSCVHYGDRTFLWNVSILLPNDGITLIVAAFGTSDLWQQTTVKNRSATNNNKKYRKFFIFIVRESLFRKEMSLPDCMGQNIAAHYIGIRTVQPGGFTQHVATITLVGMFW